MCVCVYVVCECLVADLGRSVGCLVKLMKGGRESLLLEDHKQSSCMLYPTRDGEEDRRNRGVRWLPLVGVNIT